MARKFRKQPATRDRTGKKISTGSHAPRRGARPEEIPRCGDKGGRLSSKCHPTVAMHVLFNSCTDDTPTSPLSGWRRRDPENRGLVPAGGQTEGHCHRNVTLPSQWRMRISSRMEVAGTIRPALARAEQRRRGAEAQRRREGSLEIGCESERQVRIWKPALRQKQSFVLAGRSLVSSQDNGWKP